MIKTLTGRQPLFQISSIRLAAFGRFASQAIFWSWNLILLAFVFVGLLPLVFQPLWELATHAAIPRDMLGASLALILIPLSCVVLALTVVRRRPANLLALFYGVEIPLMAGAVVRLFSLQQLNPVVKVVAAVAVAGMAAHLVQFIRPSAGTRLEAVLRLAGSTCSVAFGLTIAALMAFYVPPVAKGVGSMLGSVPEFLGELSFRDLRMAPMAVLGMVLAIYSGTLFAFLPPAALYFHGRSWWRALLDVKGRPPDDGALGAVGEVETRRSRPILAVAVPTLTVALIVAALAVVGRQPQGVAFAALAPIEDRVLSDSSPTAAEEDLRVDLRGLEDEIRAGLLNAYLAPYRYIGSLGSNNHIEALYEGEFGVSPETAHLLQNAYNRLASPVLYQGESLAGDQLRAAELYRAVFDVPLQEAERDSVLEAVQSTWVADQAEAGLLDVGQQRVHLDRQEITVVEHGDWAEVELYEVYRNQTLDRQEVLLYFSLPEAAAMTGLWLGPTPDRAERFEYQVAPRGAAQEVYRDQLVRKKDPALLEQLGPGQYRLRVFPIEPPGRTWDEATDVWSTEDEAPPMYMWLTYATLPQSGKWPLPAMAEVRNLYWDDATDRIVNTAAVAGSDDWMPEPVAASSASPAIHTTRLADGTVVTAKPQDATDSPAAVVGSMAIVVDRSASMAPLETEVADAIRAIAAAGYTGDVYLTSPTLHPQPGTVLPLAEAAASLSGGAGSDGAGANQTDAAARPLVFFGGSSPAEVLSQFVALREQRTYDAVLVLIDNARSTAEDDLASAPPATVPLWFVHLQGRFPPAYDDATLEAIQSSGGGVAGTVDEALTQLATRGSPKPVHSGYSWDVQIGAADSAPAAASAQSIDGFTPIAARQVILQSVRDGRGAALEPAEMDRLHAIAVSASVVTPYSSMIVLVDEAQRHALWDAEQRADRFNREVETGEEALGGSGDPMAVTGVPEPEEWLLILLATAFLAKLAWERRRGPVASLR